jgi:thioredoxin 1
LAEKSEDEEIERINKKKLEDLFMRKKAREERSAQASSAPIELTDSNFFSMVSRYPLMVVDFWAAWCGPCRMVSPIIEQLAKEYSGRVAFGKLNVDENPSVSNGFGVQSIPTILIFKDGKQVDGLIGAVPKQVIESKFGQYLGGSRRDSLYG